MGTYSVAVTANKSNQHCYLGSEYKISYAIYVMFYYLFMTCKLFALYK